MHRNAPVSCPACGRTVRRNARQQVYCSARCRKRGAYARAVAEGKFDPLRYPPSANGTNPQKNTRGTNGLQGQKSRSAGFADAPLDLLGGGSWHWPDAPALDPLTRAKIIRAEIGGRVVTVPEIAP